MEENKEKRTDKNAAHTEEDASFGPYIAVIIIITLLVLGAFYLLKKTGLKNSLPVNGGLSRDRVIDSIILYDTSDDMGKIQRDLAATSIQAVDRGLDPLTKNF